MPISLPNPIRYAMNEKGKIVLQVGALVYGGKIQWFDVPYPVKCPGCDGTKTDNGDECDYCNGEGFYYEPSSLWWKPQP